MWAQCVRVSVSVEEKTAVSQEKIKSVVKTVFMKILNAPVTAHYITFLTLEMLVLFAPTVPITPVSNCENVYF